ncbi:hypothetical protein D6D25_09237, partial [Aureobasidium pullulans]
PLTSPPSPKSNPLDRKPYSSHNYPTYSDSDSDADNTPLPFPAALPRSDFLTPNFTPEAYLSTLSNRHQTLEDLRSDLRQRSQLLSKELLDLVNANYEEFLSLGLRLKGGEEKIEEVRVGVLGFSREVGNVRDAVAEKVQEFGTLLEEKKRIRKDVMVGRRLLEIEERLEDLEARLMVEPSNSLSANNASANDQDSDSDEDEDYEDGDGDSATSATLARLRKLQNAPSAFTFFPFYFSFVGYDRHYISASQASAIVSAAEKAAASIVPQNIAVVDPSGLLVAFLRMDNAYPGSIDISIKKARTSVLFNGIPSGALLNQSYSGGGLYGIEETNGGIVVFG